MINKNILILCLVFFLHACSNNKRYLPSSSHLNLEKNHGIWVSQGYGYLLDINHDGLLLFDTNGDTCISKNLGPDELAQFMSYFIQLNNDTIQIAAFKGSTAYTFTRLNGNLPLNCLVEVKNTPRAVFEYFAMTMQYHYAFFDLYEIDWQQRVNNASKNISDDMSESELYSVITSMLDGINDAHLSIQAMIDGKTKIHNNGQSRYLRPSLDKAFTQQIEIKNGRKFRRKWYQSHLKNIKNNILTTHHLDFNDRILWGTIGDVGYINILGMQGFTESGLLDEEINLVKNTINQIMSQLKNSRAIIVDVTTNSGGSDEISLIIASHFTDKRVLAYSKSAIGSIQPKQNFFLNPISKNPYLAPVYLLTSDHTVSAAEVFTMVMRSLPHVIHVGDQTRGALSDILDKSLPNGWEFGLSNEVYLDAKSVMWEGRGIIPDKNISVFSNHDLTTGHQKAISEILQLIN